MLRAPTALYVSESRCRWLEEEEPRPVLEEEGA